MTFKIDIIHERNERQPKNDEKVIRLLTSKFKVQDLKKNSLINPIELDRFLKHYSIPKDKDGIAALAMLISVKASRQGSKDELTIINGINDALDGMSLVKPKKEKRIDGVDKSIDAILQDNNGKIIAYVFCKVVSGSGGHQDNVIFEAIQFLKSSKNKDDDILRVCLIDGDFKRKEIVKFTSDKAWLCNHQQFQEKLQKRYGIELKEINDVINYKNPLEELLDAD
jgi:hypothetical protein